MKHYDPSNWFWSIAGDKSRFWSSAAREYVAELPENAGLTNIASEEELWEVLRSQAPEGLPIPTLEHMKAAAIEQVRAEAELYAGRLTAEYSLPEVLSFTAKSAEARAILDGATDPALFPIIASEAQFANVQPADIARKVAAKSAFFSNASGAVSGIRQTARLKIEQAKSLTEVEAALKWARGAADDAFATISAGG